MKVDFYFKGSIMDFKELKDKLKSMLKVRVPRYEISYIAIETDEDAKKFRVIGIPTIKFNGRDIEKEKRTVREFSSSTRNYTDSSGNPVNFPPDQMIQDAISEYIEDSATFHVEVKGAKKGETPIC